MASDAPPTPPTVLSLAGLAHPGWFGGVMGTAALSRALVGAHLGPFDQLGMALSWVLMVLAALLFLAAVTAGLLSLRNSPDTLRDRVVSPILGPLFAAVPGGVFTLLVALLGHEPDLLQHPVMRGTVLVLTVLTLVLGFWLTLTFFVTAFEHDNFEAHSISGTWFLPETVILLGVLVLHMLTVSFTGSAAHTLAAATVAVMGAGFILFLLTAALFFSRMVLQRQHHEPGVAAVWILMSPLSVSSLALGAAAASLPHVLPVDEQTILTLVSLGSGMLWGFGLWWLAAALLLTFHHGRRALTFSPGSWAYVFPLSAISLASADLARVWDSGAVAGLGVALLVFTLAVWTVVAVAATRWVMRRGWR